MTSSSNLTRADAHRRATLIAVDSYDVDLDLSGAAVGGPQAPFRSLTTVHFRAAQIGSRTFIDLVASEVHSATLNGTSLDVSEYQPSSGLALPDLQDLNVLVVEAEHQFSRSGEGLHRFVDPVDGNVYLHSQFEPAHAQLMFACFDQPDLKARYTISARVPHGWHALSNGALLSVEAAGTECLALRFAETERISSYVVALCAGPYYGVQRAHGPVELGLWCRQSLAEHLDADALFGITANGLDWYERVFDSSYPFGKYDQVFAPEFAHGAMENPGCVTLSEDKLFRTSTTDAEHERRALHMLHEMAHMWFGDLVTMRWWDDLWLKESFAEYISVLCQTQTTQWTDAWTTFVLRDKTWAYEQDQLPTTHPVVTDSPDVETGETNFDGITYAKGASVIKQLVSFVGSDAFITGLRTYVHSYAFATATLLDLLAEIEKASGRDVHQWSRSWLETTGIDAVSAEFDTAPDGTLEHFRLRREPPNGVDAGRVHRLAVGLYIDDGLAITLRERVEIELGGSSTPIPELDGLPVPTLVLVNDGDLSYCKPSMDPSSLRALKGHVHRIDDPLARSLVWTALWEKVRDGELAARELISWVVASAEHETHPGLLRVVLQQSRQALALYAEPDWAGVGYQQLADLAVRSLAAASAGTDFQQVWLEALSGLATNDPQLEHLHDLLSGAVQVPGTPLEGSLRWKVIQALAAHGRLQREDIEGERAEDGSDEGQLGAITAIALLPDPAGKEQVWASAMHDRSLSFAELRALVSGFSSPFQGALLAEYAARYATEISDVYARRGFAEARFVAKGLFPLWSSAVTPATCALVETISASANLPRALDRIVREGSHELRRALVARSFDARS